MRYLALSVGLAALLLTSGCAGLRADKALRVASGLTSHRLCTGSFISQQPPDTVFTERVAALPEMGLIAWSLDYRVDRQQRTVETYVLGGFQSQAQFRPGLGCLVRYPDDQGLLPVGLSPADMAFIADQAAPPEGPVILGPPLVQRALRPAPTTDQGPSPHPTKAVVVMKDGALLAEYYAPGYSPETPVPGFSLTKSVMNALVGVMVKAGRLRVDQPAPIPAWSDPNRPHPGITIDHLLRQTSGLDLPADNSGFDLATQIAVLAWDKAYTATKAPLAAAPGGRWAYSDPNSILLARALSNVIGGNPGQFWRFAQRSLFSPLGMTRVSLDFDGAGTPMGAASMHASARDWARLGVFFLNGGQIGDDRLLPDDWIDYSTRPTLETGYGAGFWINRYALGPLWGMPNAPPGSYFARGFQGQFIVIIPSEGLVVVRLAAANGPGDDIAGMNQLVGKIRQAIADSLP